MKIKIYAGLSIDKSTIHQVLPTAVVAGPVRRDDLIQDIKDGMHIVGLIDGVFFQEPSVSPSEILDALRFGIKVFGSSSIGALRAVELQNQGLIGVGRIFDWIRHDAYFKDDWLGQVFANSPAGKWQSPAPIDFVMAAQSLLKKNKISARLFNKVLLSFATIHFSTWDPQSFIERFSASEQKLLRPAVQAPSQKHTDALLLLQEIKIHIASVREYHR